MSSLFQILDEEGEPMRPTITPAAIRHLPTSRQRRYVRLAVLEALRVANRDLSVSEIREHTQLDERTIRRELANLVGTREVERIQRLHCQTYRPIGQPTSLFAKHLVRLARKAYTIEHVRSMEAGDLLVIQERSRSDDGSYEPVGGLTVSRNDFEAFLTTILRRGEEAFGSDIDLGRR